MSATATLRTTRPVGEPSEASKNALAALGSTDEQAADNLIKELGLNEPDDGRNGGEKSPTPLAMTQRTSQAVSKYVAVSDGGLEGEWSDSDMKFPTMKIVQGSGPLSKEFTVGSLISGEDYLLNPVDPKAKEIAPGLRIIPVKIKKQFRENLPEGSFEAGIMPRVVDSIQQVEALGGHTQWIGDQKPPWAPCATCLFLVEQPDFAPGNQHPAFSQEINGKNYAILVYYAASSGFTNCAKVIFQAQLNLMETVGQLPNGKPDRRLCLYKNIWTFRAIRKEVKNFTVIVPEVKMTRDLTPPDVRAFIRETILGQEAVVAKAAGQDE